MNIYWDSLRCVARGRLLLVSRCLLVVREKEAKLLALPSGRFHWWESGGDIEWPGESEAWKEAYIVATGEKRAPRREGLETNVNFGLAI